MESRTWDYLLPKERYDELHGNVGFNRWLNVKDHYEELDRLDIVETVDDIAKGLCGMSGYKIPLKKRKWPRCVTVYLSIFVRHGYHSDKVIALYGDEEAN